MKPNGDSSVAKKEWRENEVKDAVEYTMSGSLSFSAIKTEKEKKNGVISDGVKVR